jgi:hypothetical protein
MKWRVVLQHKDRFMRWIVVGTVCMLVAVSLVVGLMFWPSTAPTIIDTSSTVKMEREIISSSAQPPVIQGASQSRNISGSGVNQSLDVSSGRWLSVVLVTLSIATCVATGTSFYLYKWRRILMSEPHLVVPEQSGAWLKSLEERISNQTDALGKAVRFVAEQSQETNKNVSDLSETFMTLQQALDDRDSEIRRLKRGYDAEVFRKFVSRFIRVDQLVADLQAPDAAEDANLEQVRRLLEDAFAECGVEIFQPEIGEDYRKAHGVADNPKSVAAEDPEDAFKIKEITESGYQINHTEGCEVIIPAKVVIYSV